MSESRSEQEETIKFLNILCKHKNLWDTPEDDITDEKRELMKFIQREISGRDFSMEDVPNKSEKLASNRGTKCTQPLFLPSPEAIDFSMITGTVKKKETCCNSGIVQFFTIEKDYGAALEDRLNNKRARLESTPGNDKSSYNIPSSFKQKLETVTDAEQESKDLNETMTTQTTAIQKDECDVMGQHIAIQLQKLPPYDRVLVNLDLQKILMDYRLRNMRTVSSSTSFNHSNSVASTIQSNP